MAETKNKRKQSEEYVYDVFGGGTVWETASETQDYVFDVFTDFERPDTATGEYVYSTFYEGVARDTQFINLRDSLPHNINPDMLKEIRQFKEEYAKWVRWHAYYHNVSPIPIVEAAKYFSTWGRGGFVCLDWEQATYKWAKEATKQFRYIGEPEERLWYLENFVTVPISGGGHIILDPFLFGTPAPQIPW